MEIRAEIFENTSCYEDFESEFKYSRWILYLTAAWPDHQNPNLKVCSRLVNVLYFVFMLGALILHGCTMFYKRDEVGQFFEIVGLINVYAGIFLEYVILISQSKTIRACIRQMDINWKYMFKNSRKIMLKHAKISRLVFLTQTSTWLGVWLSWHITVWLQKPIVIDNVTLYALPYDTYFKEFDARTAPYCFFVYIIHFLADGFM